MRARHALRLALPLALSLLPVTAFAQSDCVGYAGCASADIAYHHREGLPVEFDVDTGWQPPSAPVQVRFRAVLAGHTQVDMAGSLRGAWPEPMALTVRGTPGAGSLAVDYGVVISARIRLALDVEGRTISWEGDVPYVPRVDFRAMASTTFDPWAWSTVMVTGHTMRTHLADVSITDAIVRIPGISGGLSFDAVGEVDASWRSTRFTFGLEADPLTMAMPMTQGIFMAGPSIEYHPALEGELAYRAGVRVIPSLYVALAGRRWMLDIAELPLVLGPFPRTVRLDAATAHLGLPDFHAERDTVDFGDVDIGDTREELITVANQGEATGELLGADGDTVFEMGRASGSVPDRARVMVPVTFRPVRPGRVEGTVVVRTNDPDTPRVRVAVRGVGVVRDAGIPDVPSDASDTGVDTDGGTNEPSAVQDGSCACSVLGRAPRDPVPRGAWIALGLVVLARRRRTETDR